MRNIVLGFLRRGMFACGFGPIVLAIVYLSLQHFTSVELLTVNEVCIGIFSLSALAFIAGGMNAIYQMERLPLMLAILLHGGVFYAAYLVTYLFNGWLDCGETPVMVFTGIFILGYFVVWGIIYISAKKKTEQINKILKEKQKKGIEAQNFLFIER